MEQNGPVQLETNARAEAIRRDLNVFIDRCTGMLETAVREAQDGIAQSEKDYMAALKKARNLR